MIGKLHPIFKVEQLLSRLEKDFKVVLQSPTKFTASYAFVIKIVGTRSEALPLAVRCRNVPP